MFNSRSNSLIKLGWPTINATLFGSKLQSAQRYHTATIPIFELLGRIRAFVIKTKRDLWIAKALDFDVKIIGCFYGRRVLKLCLILKEMQTIMCYKMQQIIPTDRFTR